MFLTWHALFEMLNVLLMHFDTHFSFFPPATACAMRIATTSVELRGHGAGLHSSWYGLVKKDPSK